MTALSKDLGCQHPFSAVDGEPSGRFLHSDLVSRTSRVKRKPLQKKKSPRSCTVLTLGQYAGADLGEKEHTGTTRKVLKQVYERP